MVNRRVRIIIIENAKFVKKKLMHKYMKKLIAQNIKIDQIYY